jgi:hypothetical protein
VSETTDKPLALADPLLSKEQAAAVLGGSCTARTISGLSEKGRLQTVVVAKRMRVRLSELERFVKELEQGRKGKS